MTISSLAKIIVGVNRMVVENVEIEYPEINPTLIISVRPTKKDSCRCGISLFFLRKRKIPEAFFFNTPGTVSPAGFEPTTF